MSPPARLRARLAGAAMLSALAVATCLAAPAVGAGGSAVTWVVASRESGADRYQTAVAVSRATFPLAPRREVILASGALFADALSATGYAGTVDAPILLVPGTGPVPASVALELARLAPSRITVIGGPGVVSAATVASVQAPGRVVTRLYGADRYATCFAVARAIGRDRVGSHAARRTVLVTAGTAFADALAAGPAAVANQLPLILTPTTALPPGLAQLLRELGTERAIVVGSGAVVSDAVVRALEAILGPGSVQRIAGSDRFQTAARLATFLVAPEPTGLGFDATEAVIANGLGFADAVGSSVLAGRSDHPLLFTTAASLPTPTADFLRSHRSSLTSLVAVGSASVVSDAVVDAARDAAGNAPPPLIGSVSYPPAQTGEFSVAPGGIRGLDVAAGKVAALAAAGPDAGHVVTYTWDANDLLLPADEYRPSRFVRLLSPGDGFSAGTPTQSGSTYSAGPAGTSVFVLDDADQGEAVPPAAPDLWSLGAPGAGATSTTLLAANVAPTAQVDVYAALATPAVPQPTFAAALRTGATVVDNPWDPTSRSVRVGGLVPGTYTFWATQTFSGSTSAPSPPVTLTVPTAAAP